MDDLIAALAPLGDLSAILAALGERGLDARLRHVWNQGEFHHDVVFELTQSAGQPPTFLIVATNCNGGVKELIGFEREPVRSALWHWRCPESPEFDGELPPRTGWHRSFHWFEPCVLLADDARSELRPEHRVRQPGGGWCMAPEPAKAASV